MKQNPSQHLLVVTTESSRQGEAAIRLRALGTVKPLEGTPRLLLLTIRQDSLDPESAWSRAGALLGDLGSVQPVLLDELGNPHLPTGEISVRFNEVPADDRLRSFAAEHDLCLRDRNELVPQQAVFRPAAASVYLPNLLKELSQAKEAMAVWANTLTRFQRAGI
jgi:hypothetical protein